MSTDRPNPIELLKEVYKHVSNGEKEKVAAVADIIKQVMAENEEMRGQVDAATLPEAPASATVKVVDPTAKMEWLVTVRTHSAGQLIEEMTKTVERLHRGGYIGFDTYVDLRRAERGQDTQEGKAQANPGNPPMCPTHNKPMKQSQQGTGWYCPVKVAEAGGGSDGSKPIYCKAKVG